MAPQKDRNRRYESASALAEDVERHLRGEPIEARPASRFYRVKKFIRRNRVLVASSTAVVVALAAGLALATAGLLHALQQRDLAKQAEENARLAKEFAEKRADDLAAGSKIRKFLPTSSRYVSAALLAMNPGRDRTVYDSIA